MTSTTYYNLNIVEGTDIVNPLIVDNPNYEKIDEAMHNNAVAGVTLATEITNATVHAITRENSDCAVIRFIATSEWKAGDTATVDGVPVTALLPSGETLPDGAYVINANVLCILTGTNLTFYLEKKNAENANEIPFNDTTVGAELVRLDGKVVRLDAEVVRLDGKIDNVNRNENIDILYDTEIHVGSTVTINNLSDYSVILVDALPNDGMQTLVFTESGSQMVTRTMLISNELWTSTINVTVNFENKTVSIASRNISRWTTTDQKIIKIKGMMKKSTS